MEGQHVVWRWSGVRVLGYILGKQSVQEKEGDVSERYGEQHGCLSIRESNYGAAARR